MTRIDSAEAKKQLLRIDEVLEEKHIIIGGLAVKQYYTARVSKDIDLICSDDIRNSIVNQIYPSSDWEVHDLNDNEYRPDYHILSKNEDGLIISFGPKITEREPYQNIEWEKLKIDSLPFKVENTPLRNIYVPSAHGLAYTKLLSFFNRTNGKELQDLQDFVDLTNSKECSLEGFYQFLRGVKDLNKLKSDFDLKIKTKKYAIIFESGNLFKIINFFNAKGTSNHFISGIPFQIPNILVELDINPLESNKEYGILSTIPENKFHFLRRKLLGEKTKNITLVGASLNAAFNPQISDRNIYIGDIIEEKLSNSDDCLEEVQIYITDPTLIDEPINSSFNGDKPIGRIETTLGDLIKISKKIHPSKKLKVYFIPLLQLDHLVITDEKIISRNTMLWTGDNTGFGLDKNNQPIKIKGTWLLGEKTEGAYSLFESYSRFISILRDNCTIIPLTKDYSNELAITLNSKGIQLANNFRNHFRRQNSNNNLSTYKLYHRQLISFARSTWFTDYKTSINEISWENKNKIVFNNKLNYTAEDIHKPENLLNDPTQNLLIPYIKVTENLLNEVVQKYDKSGFAKIIPSLELGVPNNVQRLAGGFATGSLVLWKCGTPILPVDTTVNICTSTVLEVNSNISEKLTQAYFENLKLKGNNEAKISNFEDGNHFITFGKGINNGKFYLVLHSSAKEFKYSALGLYPHRKSWFKNNIKTHYSKDGSRYLRYIKDEEAIDFVNIVNKIDKYNIETHDWFGSEIAGNGNFTKLIQKHHYFMPNSSSVAIGTFLIDQNEIVPIFSDRGKEIALYKANNKWGIKLGERKKILVPHGWGQEFINNPKAIVTDIENNLLKIGEHSIEISEKNSLLNKSISQVRRFETFDNFLNNGQNYVQGFIVELIKPIISISRHGYEKF